MYTGPYDGVDAAVGSVSASASAVDDDSCYVDWYVFSAVY